MKTDGQAYTETYRQTDIQTDRETDTQAYRQTDRKVSIHTVTDRHTDR